MAQITIKIVGETTDIDSKVAKIKKDLAELGNVKIGTESAKGGVKELNNQVQQTTANLNNAKVAADKLTEVFVNDKLTRTIKEHNYALGESKKIIDEVIKGEQTHTEVFTHDAVKRQKYLSEATKAYEQYAAEIAKNAPKTALQEQIEGITGVSREFQSAEQYARRFIEKGIQPQEIETINNRLTQSIQSVSESYGELIDSQTKWANGLPVSQTNTYRDALGNVTKVTATLDDQGTKLTTTMKAAGEATKKQADAAENAARKNSILGDSFGHIVAKITAWQVVNAAVATVVRSLREAINTMKEVDTQLTNIAKVSDLSASEIKRIGDTAYDTASKYGVSANEYLEAVYTFQKAGIGESSEAMAELATKTMLVGDTTAEVATRFLIAANAAWKFGGNMTELSRIVDEADKLNNTYAVTLEDIATGLPIVGATAAQVGMTAEQTMAAISTIVASTGQSASKAATALRAIIMNLIGETGELEDGTKVTEETIKSLNTVLNEYAAEALEVAEAEGKILDPMEAIAALAKAAEDGFLNEAELFNVLSGLGGKLRTTQLTALVNNTEMYNNMLRDTANAAGTADKEISTMMTSWERKTQVLKNTWTQFLQNFINGGIFKTVITGITGIISFLDSGFGKFAATIGLVTAAVALLSKAWTAFAGTAIAKTIAFNAAVIASTASTLGLGAAIKVTGQTLWQWFGTSPLAWVAAATAAVYGLVKLFDALNVTAEEHLEKANKAYDNYKSIKSEIDQLNDKIAENNRLIEEGNEQGKSEAYIKRLELENQQLEIQKKLKNDLIASDLEKSIKEAKASYNSKRTLANGNLVFNNIADEIYWLLDGEATKYNTEELKSLFEELSQILEKLQGATDSESKRIIFAIGQLEQAWHRWSGNVSISAQDVADYINSLGPPLKKVKTETDEATEQTEEWATATENAKKSASDFAAETYGLANVIEEVTDRFSKYNSEVDSVQSALKTLSVAQEEYNENGFISVDTLQTLLQLDAEYLDALIDENGQINLNSNAVSVLIEGKKALLEKLAAEAIANYAAAEAENLLNEQLEESGVKAKTAGTRLEEAANAALRSGQKAAKGAAGWFTLLAATRRLAGESGLDDLRTDVLIDRVLSFSADIQSALSNVDLNVGGWSLSGTDKEKTGRETNGDDKDEELEKRKANIELLKQELSFLEESNASESERIEKMRDIQKALHDEAEYLRTTEAYLDRDVDALKDVKALSTEWWKYQNKILETTEKIAETLQDDIEETLAAITDALKTSNEAVTNELQERIDALKEAHDVEADNLELAEKELAVEKAQIALENAQKERNVRQYNKTTGQWEWVANAKEVEQAANTLKEAEKALQEYKDEQDYKAQIAELEAQIDHSNSVFEKAKNTIEEFSNAIQEILKSPILDAGIKEKFVEDIKNILTAPTLDEDTKVKFIENLVNIFNNEELTVEVKTKISAAISNLLGLDDGKNAAELFYDFVENALNGAKNPQKAIEELSDAISNGIIANINDIATILAALNGEYEGISRATAATLALTKMQANSIAWHMTTSQAEKDRLHDENVDLGNQLGLDYNSASGTWMKDGQAVYSLSNVGGNWAAEINNAVALLVTSLSNAAEIASEAAINGIYESTNNTSSGYYNSGSSDTYSGGGYSGGSSGGGNDNNYYDEPEPSHSYVSTDAYGNTYNALESDIRAQSFINDAPPGMSIISDDDARWTKNLDGTTTVTTADGKTFSFYDSGGILHGIGGIKATRDDEMILPPKMTKALLDAERNGSFDALLGHLGIVTAAAQSYAGFGNGFTRNSIGSQHNGDVYEFGNITLSEQQARSMTVYDLAQMSRTLSLQNA